MNEVIFRFSFELKKLKGERNAKKMQGRQRESAMENAFTVIMISKNATNNINEQRRKNIFGDLLLHNNQCRG